MTEDLAEGVSTHLIRNCMIHVAYLGILSFWKKHGINRVGLHNVFYRVKMEVKYTMAAEKQQLYAGREQTISVNSARTSQIVGRAADEMARANAIEKIPLSDLARVKESAEAYLDECQKSGFLPTVRGMAARLGLSRNSVYDYQRHHPDSEFSKFLDDFSDLCAELTISAALEGSANPVVAIFLAKARANWRDSITIETPVHDPLGPKVSVEEIMERYRDLPPD